MLRLMRGPPLFWSATMPSGMPATLADFLAGTYLATRPDLSAGRVAHLQVTIRQFSQFLGRPATIDDLTDVQVGGFLREFAATGRAPVTVNTRRSQLLCLWRASLRAGLTRDCPGEIPRWREHQRVPQAWTVDEVARLVGYCRNLPGQLSGIPGGLWWSSLLLAGYWTGARPSALRSARSADLTPEGWLLIRAEAQKTRADQHFRLPPQALDEVMLIFDPGRRLIWPWPYTAACTFWVHLRKIVEGAGLPASRRGKNLFQKLRRTAVSYAARVDLEIARQLAGHSDSRLTRRHYIDPRIASTWTIANVLPTLDLPSPNGCAAHATTTDSTGAARCPDR